MEIKFKQLRIVSDYYSIEAQHEAHAREILADLKNRGDAVLEFLYTDEEQDIGGPEIIGEIE